MIDVIGARGVIAVNAMLAEVDDPLSRWNEER